jgi:hypothetical protein
VHHTPCANIAFLRSTIMYYRSKSDPSERVPSKSINTAVVVKFSTAVLYSCIDTSTKFSTQY